MTKNIEEKLQLNAISNKRWMSKLKRAQNMIFKLARQRASLEKLMNKQVRAEIVAIRESSKPPELRVEPPVIHTSTAIQPGNADLDIPGFLKRDVLPDQAELDRNFIKEFDEARAAAVRAEVEEKKKTKARIRINKMKAAKKGDLKKMPLSGKAALDYIKDA